MRTKHDYYELLGVSKNAPKDEIKKAFRKLAKQYHPDKTKNDKAKEEKFKKINEAYAVLSNDKKRKQYDTFGAEDFSRRFSQEDIFKGYSFDGFFDDESLKNIFRGNVFSEIFGQGARKSRGGRRGSSSFGFENLFENQEPGGFTNNPGNRPPQQSEVELTVSLEDVVSGAKKRVSLDTGQGVETIEIAIPLGIEDGKKIRLKGKGTFDPYTGQRGDLHCKISVSPHPVFQRKGKDLIVDAEVKLTDLVLGGKTRINTIDNNTIELKIPPHSKNNRVLRIKGKGIPACRGTEEGNLLVKLQAILPTQPTEEQLELFTELAKLGL